MVEIKESIEQREKADKRKKVLIGVLVTLLIVPNILWIFTVLKMNGLNRKMNDFSAELGKVENEYLVMDHRVENLSEQVDSQDLAMESVTVDTEEVLASMQEQDSEGNGAADPYEGMKKICITFDDGPTENTDLILDILAEYNVQATFFVTGKSGYEEQYRRIVDEGHTLGMHSYSHSYQDIYQDIESFKEDFFEIQSFLLDVTGVQCQYYRFPGGSSNTVCNVPMLECIDFLNDQNIVYFDWNISSQDAVSEALSVSAIVDNVMDPIENMNWNTYVILMHDAVGKETTIEALPIILERLQEMDDVVIVPITETTNPVQHVLAEIKESK